MNNDLLEGVIVGGGISGLALAHFLGLHEAPGGWELWEATGRVGGTIGTDRTEGYSIDWGPNGFLDREPLTLRLAEECGLGLDLEPAESRSSARFILKGGRLHPVPLSPGTIVATGLLRWSEKLRLFAEPLVPGRRETGDESIFDFAARRIGAGAARTFVDPMVSGIFGGLAGELSLPACFPIMREMEMRYGGLAKAMAGKKIASLRRRRPEGEGRRKSGSPAGPAGWLTSFRGGLDRLVTRLQERLRPVIRLQRSAFRLDRRNGVWLITDQHQRVARARRVAIACPAFAAAGMLQALDPELASALDAIPYAPIAVLATGHRADQVSHPLEGFGFLIPRTEGLRTLGSIWTSSIFRDRAPEGQVQFRTMLGGAGDPAAVGMTDQELWQTARKELGSLLGIRGDPVVIRIYRWEKGIPQYTLGHLDRLARIETRRAKHPGLHILGNAYHGVGLNDCVKMAHVAAGRIGRESAPQTEPAL